MNLDAARYDADDLAEARQPAPRREKAAAGRDR
jgi:hypothetical protein